MTISADVEARRHLSALDGLRGFAAVVVALYHTSLISPGGTSSLLGQSSYHLLEPIRWIATLAVKFATCGPQAVILFFVLSGFVLTRAVVGQHYQSYFQFATKRFFRIWPAFAIAILISALLSYVIGRQSISDGSVWLHELWNGGATSGNITKHLLMTETRVNLDNVMWSLVHELRISFLFPAVLLAMRKWPVPTCVATVGLMFLSCASSSLFPEGTIAKSYNETLCYIFLFAFGAGLSTALLKQPIRPKMAILPSCLAMLFFLMLLNAGPKDTAHVGTFLDGLRLLICGVGALGIILVVLHSYFNEVFSSKIARYLGRVSYSLYLLHVIVLAAVLNGLCRQFSVVHSALIALVLMVPVADIYQRLVERPTDLVGRLLAKTFVSPDSDPHRTRAKTFPG
ncbi:peptidoglycan/LPS O-acetylase OafA/YrhL [Sphingomonas vulcanisoli]|uniref:Peptidoglycan/LPS O-acetylase OafA/YrhL n=1 Tax=Sphingomonas vulcanisoli TaxID=1658060 RepID=A0ABX0TS34_9SPHN|nr:acyltransferase [Sphingomonas vulcanisoli]NIJ08323.1 peptidoglycan/LPS O-acetylase OafA/YrhL [Sphingomonas vulcanisoli]